MGDTATEPDRVLLVQDLDPEKVDDYVEAHDDVPDAVTDAMERGGVHRFDLFVHDGVSIGYVVVDDFERFQSVYGDDPECMAWEERIAPFKRSGVDPDTGEMPLGDRIWSFDADGG
jgi:L-rhamnose mutarotase